MAGIGIRVDLHTHSVASHDGGIKTEQYLEALDEGILHVMAVTDHNRIDFALQMAALRPKQIIVGEEIKTRDGELIGLFLSSEIPAGLSALETAQLIRDQNGIIVAPHPLEKWRHGLSVESMNQLTRYLDAVELFNGRAFRPNKPALRQWAQQQTMPTLASSDSHSSANLGRTYSEFSEVPTVQSFRRLAEASIPHYKRATCRGRLAPSVNRIRKRGKQ